MKKLLLFSYSCFSDTSANGITMKNLLSAWPSEEKAAFYCEAQSPDFDAAHQYFRITDLQALKSFFGKKSRCVFNREDCGPKAPCVPAPAEKKEPRKIPAWLKKYKYNFALKWIREYFWILGPWDKKSFWRWLEEVSPGVLFYMVGESIFMDRLVLQVCKKTKLPLVLYNGEGYHIIDLKSRKRLERAYYRKIQKLYEKLAERAALVVYNCELLQSEYESRYPASGKGMVFYNSAQCIETPYQPNEIPRITYFGNLGVGRSEELLRVARVLEKVDASLFLDIYGKATQEQKMQFQSRDNIRYHGFVDAQTLREVIEQSDILLHVETFDREYIPKLKYAFSTKIAQCLCSGRCVVSFAPPEMASSQYLRNIDGGIVDSDEDALESTLMRLIGSSLFRKECAEKLYAASQCNHQLQTTAIRMKKELEKLEIRT